MRGPLSLILSTLPLLALLASPTNGAPISSSPKASPTSVTAIPSPTTGDSASKNYIVKFKDTANIPVDGRPTWVKNQLGIDDTSDFRLRWDKAAYDGFAGPLSDQHVQKLTVHSDVEYVEAEMPVQKSVAVTRNDASWGLSRISTGKVVTGSANALTFPFTADEQGGNNVDVYILDTGVNIKHSEFEDRATFLATFAGTPDVDNDGHGTHVAGTVAGKRLGVAKKANILAVKVLDDKGSGTNTGIINGIDLVMQRAANVSRPSVINMSLGGGVSQALDDAVANAVKAGIHVVVAAGNEGADAKTSSPARAPDAITVGSISIKDTISDFSNFGSLVDILAPGEDILSADFKDVNGARSLSGTSMATPHIAGLIAYLVSMEGDAQPAAIRSRILALSNAVERSGSRANTSKNIASAVGISTLPAAST